MKSLCVLSLLAVLKLSSTAPASGFAFPDDVRRQKKLEPVITPPVLPYLEHLERDPSTLLPNETRSRPQPPLTPRHRPLNPRFGFGGGFSVEPNGDGGLTASISSSSAGGGGSQSASQSASFGFNNGFSASQSASHSSSFSGFGHGFSGSQSSSQAASFAGGSSSAAASQSSAFAGGSHSGSQSASQAFGFNGFQPQPDPSFGEGVFDVRHRGVPGFPFPGFTGRSKGIGISSFRTSKQKLRGKDDWVSVIVSDLS